MKKPVINKGTLLDAINLPRFISTHLFGEHHTERHRMAVGVVVILVGVLISKFPFGGFIIHVLCDGVGYGVHGMGCIPFIEAISKQKQ